MELYYVHVKFERSGKITGNSTTTPNGPVKVKVEAHYYRSGWWQVIDVEASKRVDELYITGDVSKAIEYLINTNKVFTDRQDAVDYWNSKLHLQLDKEAKRFDALVKQLSKKLM